MDTSRSVLDEMEERSLVSLVDVRSFRLSFFLSFLCFFLLLPSSSACGESSELFRLDFFFLSFLVVELMMYIVILLCVLV